ncbi:hypothetical protein RN001_001424 [Aquatica leii]|uniref:DUF4806 domain-containing protein n=1 Tax=Aquatica leii TaxID=1421715 RepID=A0AAN7QMV8_9COLE|nr:hypothetical protein RN001_001424 [Aquatica leii]
MLFKVLVPIETLTISLLLKLEEQNKQILALLQQEKRALLQNSLPQNNPIQFPISSLQDINILENYLQNKDNFENLCLYLSTFGGRDVTSITNAILRYLLTNHIAQGFSFFGSRLGKKAFNDLKLKTLVIASVRKTCSESITIIEKNIKDWLKYAPQRIKYQTLRQINDENQQGISAESDQNSSNDTDTNIPRRQA